MQLKPNSQPPTLNKLAYDRRRQRLSRGKIHSSAVLLHKSLFSKQTTANFFGFLWNPKSAEAPNFHSMQLHAILLLQSRDRWSVQVGLVKKVKQFFEHCEEKKTRNDQYAGKCGWKRQTEPFAAAHHVNTPPFFSDDDMNITAISKRLTLARLLRVSSMTAGSSFLQTKLFFKSTTELHVFTTLRV